jgi:hypothetical protein
LACHPNLTFLAFSSIAAFPTGSSPDDDNDGVVDKRFTGGGALWVGSS